MTLFFTTILGLIILDFTLFGFLAYFFKIYPPYRHLLREGVLLRDDTRNLAPSLQGDRFKSLILTNNHIILRNSLFTSVRNIEISSVINCIVKSSRKDKSKIIIYFLSNGKKAKLSFKSDKADKWIYALREIDIKVDTEYEEV
jgi:hypothetical protein